MEDDFCKGRAADPPKQLGLKRDPAKGCDRRDLASSHTNPQSKKRKPAANLDIPRPIAREVTISRTNSF